MSDAGDISRPRRNTSEGYPQIDARSLTQKEVESYKDCLRNLFYKAGLPVAVVTQFINMMYEQKKAGGKPLPLSAIINIRSTLLFFGSVVFGTYFFSPVCYQALVKSRQEAERQGKEELDPFGVRTEKPQPSTLPDDYAPLSSVVHEEESTFTTEFIPSSNIGSEIILEDEPVRSAPKTTYQDLRRQHRTSFTEDPSLAPRQPRYVPPENPATGQPPPQRFDREPQRYVKRNKYGDEME